MIEVSIEIALIALVCSCLMFANGDLSSRAFYMSCERRAISVEAKCLTDKVFDLIEPFSQDGERSTKKRQRAMEAVIADLLLSHERGEHGYCYRSRMNNSFTGEWIGREPFSWAIDRLEKAGLVDTQAGIKGVPLTGVPGQASRFFIQSKLVDLASSCGIGRGDIARHFLVAPNALGKGLVIVRAGSTKEYGHYGKKIKGRRIGAASRHKVVKETNVMLTAVNSRLHEARITPPGTFVRLQRVFNNGDSRDFDYNSGGRNYDRAGKFQNMKKAERAFIEIDGEGVVEVDIQACHFLILRSLLGHKFDPSEDPYDIPGIDRDVVKAYMAMALGGKTLPDAWHPQARKSYEQAIIRQGNPLLQKDISKVCRAKDVKAALLIKYPFLGDWKECQYRWDSFQFEESSIMLNALYDMAVEHNIPALPLHDAVIVRKSDKEQARSAIKKAFHNRFGIIPVITFKERRGEE